MHPTRHTIPAEHLTVGLVIEWPDHSGELSSGSIEDIYDQPDDESVYVEICFDGARYDEGFTIPYGTEVALVHACQFEAYLARQEAAAAKLDLTLADMDARRVA